MLKLQNFQNGLFQVKQLLGLVTSQHHDTPVIEVLDGATAYVINKYIEHVPLSERVSVAGPTNKYNSIVLDRWSVYFLTLKFSLRYE